MIRRALVAAITALARLGERTVMRASDLGGRDD